MQLSHAVAGLEAAVETQLRVAGAETGEMGALLMAALEPAIRQTLTDVVSMAAAEVSSQLPGQEVEVRVADGDPELVVVPDAAGSPPPTPPRDAGADQDEARITLRLPSYLKDLIAEVASNEGDSVNTFVVDALRTKTRSKEGGATRHKGTINL